MAAPLIWLGLHTNWSNHKNTLVSQLSELSVGVGNDVSAILIPLNHMHPQPDCDSTVLTAMQQADFKANFLTNISLVRDGLILCSSLEGRLSTPVPLAKPDFLFADGGGFTLHQPLSLFGGRIDGKTVHQGAFIAYLDYPSTQTKSNLPWLSFVNFHFVEGDNTFTYGNRALPTEAFVAPVAGLEWYQGGYWLFSECSSEVECIVVGVDIMGYIADQQAVGGLIVIFLATALTLATLLGLSLHRWLYSMPRQVRRGINRRQLTLNYQPIVDIASGQIAGCEVLCRWQTADGVPVRPDLFIPVVEQNNQTRELSAQVVTSCIGELRQAGLIGRCQVAINAFPDDIASGHICELLCRLLPVKYYPLFTVELTEKQIDDLDNLCEGVHRLRALGFKVAIDDFGTGFSNLEGLRELSVDHLKIDKSFIWGAEKPSLKQRLVEHIVNIAKSLRLKIVAEGVETHDQLNFLRQINVDYTQGYLHSRPVGIKEFVALLDGATKSTRPDDRHDKQTAEIG
ncbi:EAL domain-containing protein [Photobacterium sp. OFAV2-7]|uniref:EAL domain-containing protein n=1 Tax=Photobacterium sp. OFAV2-7 TaxID=2917748 RepID=UPI001EF58ABE|nr:EAL domain-containing protein [Photobacterium sp. OFAV2-7]MCG7584926.1 EAL domain-containing protein [Photobacterium sp. OFAV2-7]